MAATAGLTPVVTQRDFSGGMFRGVREDLIPENGVWDATNGLLDNTGAIYRRGGTTYKNVSSFGTRLTYVGDGYLTGGLRTVLATPTEFGVLNADGTVTSLGGTGLTVPGRGAVFQGLLYLPGGVTYDGTTLGVAAKVGNYYAVAGNRLFVASGDRIDFSDIGTGGIPTTTFNVNDYHQVPEGVQVIGLEGLRNALVAFTTGGVWVYSNIGFDLTDSAGNVQQRVDRYSRDLILWGDAGIAAWEGGLVVPALDGVWIMSVGVVSESPEPFRRASTAIDALYRDYVNRGYRPGKACVYRGHYLLPIIDVTGAWADLLVCRLDAPGMPWTRLAGYGAQLSSLVSRANATTGAPELIGGSTVSGRVLGLSFFDPGITVPGDADGTTHMWSVQTRDMATGRLNENTIVRLRMGYDLADPATSNPTIQASHISGRSLRAPTEWGLFDWGTADWAAVAAETSLSGSAPEDPFAYTPYTWSLAKRERFGRFRLVCTAPAATLTLRWLEMFVRQSGRL